MIDGRNFFDQPTKNDIKIYKNIQKITTGRGDYYTTGCLLDFNYLKKHKMIAIDLSKNKHLMLIQKQYNKLILLEMFFIIEEAKNNFRFFIKNFKSIVMLRTT